MTTASVRATADPSLRERLASVRVPLGGAGALLLVLGSLLPWAAYRGYADGSGSLSIAGSVTPPRLYTLLLAAAVALLFFDVPGRRKALIALGAGAAGVSFVVLLGVADAGGGIIDVEGTGKGILLATALAVICLVLFLPVEERLRRLIAAGVGVVALLVVFGGGLGSLGAGLGEVGAGLWLALLGGVLLALAGTGLDQDRAVLKLPVLPGWAELLLVPLLMALLLAVVVVGLRIEDAALFMAFLVFVGALTAAAGAVGISDWLSAITERHRNVLVIAALIAAIAFPFTQDGNAYYIRVFASIGVFAAAAIGLNVVVGLAGLLDLGYIAFFGVGAYVGALFAGAALTTSDIVLPFPLVVLLGAVIAAIFGVLIGAPTLRLRGDYLAIVTLGFGEIFRIAANNLDGQAGPNITRGPNGIAGIPDLKIGSYDFGDKHDVLGVSLPGFANYYFLEILLLVFVITAFLRLNTSRVGRAWVAIREDETAATAMGINTIRLKLLAFGIGAFLAGAAGTVNSHVTAQVSPDSYTFLESIFLLAAVVLGGMGTVPGALLGSTLLLLLPEKLRFFSEYRLLIFGLALVLLMRFRPEGLIASRRRKAEFHESDADNDEADALSAPPSMTGGLK